MGIRTEIILVLLIVVVVVGSFNVELNTTVEEQKLFTKEMDFTNTTFREVDTKSLQAIAYGTHGVRDAGVLTIKNLIYSTDIVKSLIADKGTYIGSIIYLEGKVVFKDMQGYHCASEQAEYDQQTEILNITSPYIATRAKNRVFGDTMTYNTRTKEAYGTVIDAIVYTVDK